MSTQDKQCKLCRFEGAKLFLKGARCYTNKCSFERRAYAPGIHGQKPRRKPSDYATHLREKQRARRMYGISERQFANYFYKAASMRGVTGDVFLRLLETRLDNVVFRLGLATSRRQARQLVGHGHLLVNGRKVNIPSYRVKAGDQITVAERSKEFVSLILEAQGEYNLPEWLTFSKAEMAGNILALPERSQIDAPIQDSLIVEYYSK